MSNGGEIIVLQSGCLLRSTATLQPPYVVRKDSWGYSLQSKSKKLLSLMKCQNLKEERH